jgi:proliferating cell nuclear antigen
MFRLKTFNGRALKGFLSAASVVVDEATFQLSPEGVWLRALDPSKVAMVELELPKSAFEEYECSEVAKLCINLGQLLKVLKRNVRDEAVELKVEAEKLKVTLTGRCVRSFTMPTLQPTEEEPSEIKAQLTVKAVVDVEALRQAIEDAELAGGETVTVHADGDKLAFNATGAVTNAVIEFEKGSDALISLEAAQPAEAAYALNHLAGIVKEASTLSEVVSLEFAIEMPLKMEIQRDGRLTFYLAPRIEPI